MPIVAHGFLDELEEDGLLYSSRSCDSGTAREDRRRHSGEQRRCPRRSGRADDEEKNLASARLHSGTMKQPRRLRRVWPVRGAVTLCEEVLSPQRTICGKESVHRLPSSTYSRAGGL